jgi:hypothetical protein
VISSLRQQGTLCLWYGLVSPCGAKQDHTKGKIRSLRDFSTLIYINFGSAYNLHAEGGSLRRSVFLAYVAKWMRWADEIR